MRIVSRLFCDWPKDVQRRLLRATLVDGSMRYCVRQKPDTRTYVAFTRRGEIMGWLLIWPTRKTGTFATMFVNKRFRKDGVAYTLLSHAVEQHRPLNVLGWDKASMALFRKVQAEHPGKLNIIDWKPFRAKHGQLQGLGT